MRTAVMTTQYLLTWIPAFQTLTNEELDALSDRLTRQSYNAGEIVIRQGEPATECFVVVTGTAVVAYQDRAGASLRTVAMLKTGDLFGEIALIQGTVRSASVTAAEPLECLVLPGEVLQHLLESNHAFALGLLRMAVSRLSEIQRPANS